MPQFVSSDHKEMMRRLREIFTYADVIGWPDAEVNLGHMVGASGVNLRADAFVRLSTRQATVVEWQSEIHTEEGCKNKEWFDYDEIAGRDNLKRQLCVKAGCSIIELWTLDMSDEMLEDMVYNAAMASCLSNLAMDYLDGTKDQAAFFTPSAAGFKSSDLGFAPSTAGFKPATEGFKKSEAKWPKRKFGR